MFFAVAQFFGSFGPWVYGKLIGNGTDHTALFIGYLLGAGVMLLGAVIEAILGVDAEGRSLEDIALPLALAGRLALSPPRRAHRCAPAPGRPLGARSAFERVRLRRGGTTAGREGELGRPRAREHGRDDRGRRTR